MKSPIRILLILSLGASSAFALPPAKGNKKKQRDSGFGLLMARITKFLSADEVQRSHVTAIAAVRGGIPKDQGEDLDQRLLDQVNLLRGRLLSAAPAASDEAALRPIYRALAVSQWAQSLELDPAGGSSAEARDLLNRWAKSKKEPAPSDPLKALLSDAKADALTDKSLVAAGWGAYCRALTPALEGDTAAAAGDRIADSETAGLDEALKGLSGAWLEKQLAAGEEAQAHFLAGSVYSQLAAAPLKSVALPPAKSLPAAESPAGDDSGHRQAAAIEGDGASSFNPRAIYGKASKAVVLIMCSAEDGQGELGSGSIIDRTGRILTNAHVVIRGSTRQAWPAIRVFLKPAKMTGDSKKDLRDPIMAKVIASDSALDLAVIKFDSLPAAFSTLPLANPDDVSTGDQVAAIGHPEQGGLWTLTTGVISTVVADLGGVPGKNAFQTDASINRGNSGGPLLNAAGEIIGVNTLMSRKAADGLAITAVNFAIKSDVAKKWLEGNLSTTLAFAPPAKTAEKTPAAETPAVKAAPKAAKQIITESKPFSMAKLIEDQIKEMENLEDEMHQEVLKHMDSDQ